MCPLFGDRVTTGDGINRTNDNTKRDYAEFMKRWDETLGRELTDAELAQRRVVGSTPPPPSDFAQMIAADRANKVKEQAAADLARRKAVAERQAAFLLEDELERDLYERVGLPTGGNNGN